MSDEDVAFYIRTFWSAILSAPWPKDDLIELGKLAYTKTPLSDVPEKTFFKLLPHLKLVARTFHDLLEARLTSQHTSSPPEAKQPSPTVPETKGTTGE
jgi:hypothetical protein